ncbi:MAG: RNA polymerase sigma-70 factor [Tannerellaceae bacterium]|jgi:RNA polymerase sigma-70 factor (ECF subfamily)|nr:RNA polymerase sigma-70 factor [Tannerellaceae bacterium]
MSINDQELLSGLTEGNVDTFSLLCTAYYKEMVVFGRRYLHQQTVCEDIVQSVFTNLWNDRKVLAIETSLKSYLFVSVRNRCLDEIRRRDSVHAYQIYILSCAPREELNTENDILHADLCLHLEKALRKLPEINREVFELNRFKGLKYREIAHLLNISERMVETLIEKALLLLRKRLREFR